MKAWAASIQIPEEMRAQLFGLALSIPKNSPKVPFNSVLNEMTFPNAGKNNEAVENYSHRLNKPVIENLETT